MSYAARTGVDWMCHLPPLHRSARVRGPEPVRLRPTAVHTVRAGQATPVKKISWPPPGLGVAWTLQVRPFHRSASVLAGVRFPTAVHAEAEVQATPLKPALGPAGAGLKVGTIRHVRPSHRSASVPSDSPVAGSNSLPTAMQDDRDVQATPARSLTAFPGRLGVGWIRHLRPSHRSARVPCGLPGGSMRPPTAAQADGEVHETPIRLPPSAGLGAGWMLQEWPFHRCARGSEVPRLLLVFPTAMQAVRDRQDAAFRLLAAAPGGLGVCWTRQEEPSHRSASVAGDWLLNTFGLEYPTARHPVAEVQATPISRPIAPPARRGVGWMAQRVPFHRSARGWNAPEESM